MQGRVGGKVQEVNRAAVRSGISVLKKGTVYSLGHTLIVALVLSGQVLSGVDSGKACVRYLYIFSQTPFATLVSEIGRIDEHIYIVSWC